MTRKVRRGSSSLYSVLAATVIGVCQLFAPLRCRRQSGLLPESKPIISFESLDDFYNSGMMTIGEVERRNLNHVKTFSSNFFTRLVNRDRL